MHLTEIILKVWAINGQYVIDVSICEVERRCQPVLTGWEQGLHEFRFLWVQKNDGLERGTVCVHENADYLLENLSYENHENVYD